MQLVTFDKIVHGCTMKKLDHNALYRHYILLIVYSYILVRSILSQAIISTEKSKINSEHEDGNG